MAPAATAKTAVPIRETEAKPLAPEEAAVEALGEAASAFEAPELATELG